MFMLDFWCQLPQYNPTHDRVSYARRRGITCRPGAVGSAAICHLIEIERSTYRRAIASRYPNTKLLFKTGSRHS